MKTAIEFATDAGTEYCEQLIADKKNWVICDETDSAIPCTEATEFADGDYSELNRLYPDADIRAAESAYVDAFNARLAQWFAEQ
ncbi:MAG: hypothetical protein Q8L20_10880 [Gammaproteobacteria bacterium]|nr:hypothetical protein [Gammaproteobacteria bacterium]